MPLSDITMMNSAPFMNRVSLYQILFLEPHVSSQRGLPSVAFRCCLQHLQSAFLCFGMFLISCKLKILHIHLHCKHVTPL